jgi:CheY-like chemotaxis protein
VSRVVTGKLRLDVRTVDLRAVVEAALDAVRSAAMAKDIRLQSVLDPRAGPVTQRVNSHVEILVSDTGQGIAAAVLPFIFERFRQADSSSTRAHGGLGLGPALVEHLVELHGGSVAAQSPGEGQGTTFVIRLPLTIAEVPAGPLPRVHPTAPTIAALPQGVRLDGLRVLVVDDDPDALAILTSTGAVLRTCTRAPEALELVQPWRPDVLVSDIEMPDEDGYSLIRKLRALDEHGGRTPAVALTAYGRMQDRVLSLTAGYTMHVPTPIDPAELATIIASVAQT